MKQLTDQEENAVGKALYDLIQIFQEIDRDMKMREAEENPERVIVKLKRRKLNAKL